MIVLDTHALLWWSLDPGKLSDRAVSILDRMEREGGFASSVSVWELGVKVARGKLDLGISIADFVARLERSGVVELVSVDTSLWLRSLSLEWDHRDPADRLIVATALERGLPVLTKDEALHSFPAVTCIW